MPYNFAADSFHTKKLCIKLSSLGVTAEDIRANISWKSAISLQQGSV